MSSEIFIEFECCLRIAANPRNEVHLKQLSNKWHFPYIPENPRIADGVTLLSKLAKESKSNTACVCAQAIESLNLNDGKLEFLRAIDIIKLFGDSLNDESKRAVYEDAEVLEKEWDRFLRTSVGLSRDLRSFLAHSALGTTQQMRQNGLALITVHSAKGLEFDVVFVVGMAQRTFPDYRALESKHLLNEEQNNAFVAVTRCRRLLYLSYPKAKMMPWGDVWQQQPSQFLAEMNLI